MSGAVDFRINAEDDLLSSCDVFREFHLGGFRIGLPVQIKITEIRRFHIYIDFMIPKYNDFLSFEHPFTMVLKFVLILQ